MSAHTQLIELIFLTIFSIIFIWQFLGYPILMTFLAKGRKPKAKDYTYQPFVSVLIPTYNEEKVIESRIKNLRSLNYPKDKYEVLIVDSASTDKTTEIIRDMGRNGSLLDLNLRVIREEKRKGKASAINYGKKFARGEIILVSDANAFFDKNVLFEMMPHFKDPKVGGVGGRLCVANTDDPIAARATFYWDLENVMKMGEASLDSACYFLGEINAWRKNLADATVKIISEDFDMSIKIRKKGYKVEYEPTAIAYEAKPNTTSDQIIQRKRTCIGTIKTLFCHWKYFLFTRNWYTTLIIPSHKVMAIASPFILILMGMLYLSIWNLSIILVHIALLAIVSSYLLIVLTRLMAPFNQEQRKQDISFRSFIGVGIFVLVNEYLILTAWKDFAIGRYSERWEMVKSTRTWAGADS